MRLTARTATGRRPSRSVVDAGVAGLFVSLLAFLSVGCSALGLLPAGSPGAATPRPAPVDRIHEQAEAALERWAQAIRDNGGSTITFVGALTSQIGDFEAAIGSDYKLALAGGAIASAGGLSDDRPGKREVRWLDGPKVDVQVLSAAEALEELIAEVKEPCDDCKALEITDANLATGLADTSSGPAEVPMWVFTIRGTAVRVTRVAVDGGVTVDPPPWDADDPPEGISIEAAFGKATARTLEVHFVGAVGNAEKPCGADYTAEAVESDLAVVVIVHEERHQGGDAQACALVGARRTAKVALDAPLGTRVVLEVRQGLPVPVQAEVPA